MYREALTKKASEFFPTLKNFGDFYLAGGTALALQIGHRVSVDFDLFCEEEITKELYPKVKKVFSDKETTLSINNLDELTIFIDGFKISFIKYPFPLIFDLAEYQDIKLLNIKEIAATKAYTINRRGSFKDYVDLFFIVADRHSSLEEIIEIAEKKYGSEFNSRLFLEQLVYLDDIEDTKIEFLKDEIDKNEIKTFFEEKIKRISL